MHRIVEEMKTEFELYARATVSIETKQKRYIRIM